MESQVFLTKYPVHVALARRVENMPARGWDTWDADFRHRAVMGLFGEIASENPREDNGVLFRVDSLPGQAPFFLVQSLVEPDNVPQGVEIKRVELPNIEAGHHVQFRITVNAIQRTKPQGIRPVPFDSDRDAPENLVRMTPWLQRRLDGALHEVEIVNHQRELLGVDRGGSPIGKRVVQLDIVDGVAVVSDSEALRRLIVKGVGRAKSYGCGLLSVRGLV